MKNNLLFLLILFSISSCLKGKPDLVEENLSISKSDIEDGVINFVLNDFGSLSSHGLKTNILPFKVATAALLYSKGHDPKNENSKTALKNLFKNYGMLVDAEIRNLPDGMEFIAPEYLGIFKGNLEGGKYPLKVRIEGSGFSCASCHGGITYNEQGEPQSDSMYLGVPNTSLNLEAYTYDVYKGFLSIVDKPKTFLSYLLKVYPQISRLEYTTIKLIFRKEIINKVRKLKRNLGRQTPMNNGGAGLTNGVASLKYQFGLITSSKNEPAETGFTSIPVIYDRSFRTSLLYDGLYSPKIDDKLSNLENLSRVVSFFTVPTSGNDPKVAAKQFTKVNKSMQFLETAKRPSYPGSINYDQAMRGQKIYQNKCASCHGEYSEGLSPILVSYPNMITPQSDMQTDSSRLDVIDQKLVDKVNLSNMGEFLTASKKDGYYPQILTSVWLSAPYLHNGSVTSLWELMNPEERSDKFLIGGHRLDYKKVGIDLPKINENGISSYADDYKPWSTPELYDTTEPGKSNTGHIKPFDQMSTQEKWDVIEYLKLL